ncbi:MAG: putative molybdenum hydroxylase, partial [Streblomastix strix]
QIPLIIDPGLTLTRELFNDDIEVVIDATINKKNKAQTNPGLAPLVVGLGPGFNAPNDVDVIIETNRGHDLGRLIFEGLAAPDTGIPETIKRVLRAPKAGVLHCVAHIGDVVNEGQTVALINNEFPVISQLSGFIRGIRDMIKEFLNISDNIISCLGINIQVQASCELFNQWGNTYVGHL